jgi:hypothetical protein
MKQLKTTILSVGLLAALVVNGANAASVVIVANGASTGPIFVTSSGTNIDLGTRLRVGTFLDATVLNNTISAYLSGTQNYGATLLALNNNFADLGTNVTNYGNASQTGTGISASQFVFNTSATLTINGTSGTRNVANGQIQNVNYTSSIGASKSVYLWTTFNNEIAIVRGSSWTTPTSDLTGLTLNLSAITASNGGVLLGNYTDHASGNDTIGLVAAVPEPSTGALMMIGAVGLVALRRLRKV